MELKTRRPNLNLLELDWQTVLNQLNTYDPKDPAFYMITINKGKDSEYRTKFMPYGEMMELVRLALEKQGLRVPITL